MNFIFPAVRCTLANGSLVKYIICQTNQNFNIKRKDNARYKEIHEDRKRIATFHPDLSKTEKQNQRDLDVFVFEFEQKVRSGKYLNSEKMTFKAFTEVWMSDYAEQSLEASTRQLYTHLLDAHIIPVIGNLKLSKIQPNQLNKLYKELATKRKDGKEGGYSSKTIKHIHNLISAVYSAAVKWNVVLDNPCDRVEPPKQTPARDKIKFFTIEQAERFISLLDEEYTTTCKAHVSNAPNQSECGCTHRVRQTGPCSDKHHNGHL